LKKFKNNTLKEFGDSLASRNPVPGGGSVAALTGSLAMGLISMVANYSLGRSSSKLIENRIKKVLKESEILRKRFLDLVDEDAKAYMVVVNARKATKAVKNKAKRGGRKVPLEVSKLCYKAIKLTPPLVKYGNKYLMSDVEVALDMLLAAFNGALANVRANS